jgi:hypothetical protein
MEHNARLLVTLWAGPDGQLFDYSYRLWGGLVRSVYTARWTVFVDAVLDAVQRSRPLDEAAVTAQVVAVEQAWWQQTGAFPTQPTPDFLEVEAVLAKRYCLGC